MICACWKFLVSKQIENIKEKVYNFENFYRLTHFLYIFYRKIKDFSTSFVKDKIRCPNLHEKPGEMHVTLS